MSIMDIISKHSMVALLTLLSLAERTNIPYVIFVLYWIESKVRSDKTHATGAHFNVKNVSRVQKNCLVVYFFFAVNACQLLKKRIFLFLR